MCVSDWRQVDGFLRGYSVSSTNKSDRHDIAEKMRKVALNTITITLECRIQLKLFYIFNQYKTCLKNVKVHATLCLNVTEQCLYIYNDHFFFSMMYFPEIISKLITGPNSTQPANENKLTIPRISLRTGYLTFSVELCFPASQIFFQNISRH